MAEWRIFELRIRGRFRIFWLECWRS